MLLKKDISGLFSLTDQMNFYRCGKCGSTDIRWHAFDMKNIWPKDIRGYVEPTPAVIECDEFGPITTRTVRCR